MIKSSSAHRLAVLMALALLASAAWALCPTAERSILVPAVVGVPEGGLLQIQVQVSPGDGAVLTTTSPRVGTMTQESQGAAVREAFRGLDVRPEECEVRFYINDGQGAPSVDGPSAGLAMTVALRAALTGASLRDDISITGTIEKGGAAGPVGGIIDKAQASARGGMRALLTPRQALYENIVLERLGLEQNFSAAEVDTLAQAMAIATAPVGTPVPARFELENPAIPENLDPREQNADDKRFAEVARRLNRMLESRLREGGIFAKPRYGSYFQQELDNGQKLLEMGYGYTAANNAFLAQVDAAFLSLPAHEPDVEGAANGALDCIKRAPDVAPTRENAEWVAGGSARIQWAMQKIEDVKKAQLEHSSSEEAYLDLREIYYAQAWCDAGSQLLDIGREIGGQPLEEEALERAARARVQEEQKALEGSTLEAGDLAWHLRVANRSLGRQLYAAALFDAAYVRGSRLAVMEELARENQSRDGGDSPLPGWPPVREEPRSEGAGEIDSKPLSTLWGRTYASQSQYTLTAADDEASAADARRVWRMALSMEQEMGALRNESWPSKISQAGNESRNATGRTGAGGPDGCEPNAPSGAQPPDFSSPLSVAVALAFMAMALALGAAIGRKIESHARGRKRR